ncbi:Uncharacterised protein [Chlamydia trachomatis]|nr:Uncharacterised protein [Chlamydia trachomatis]
MVLKDTLEVFLPSSLRLSYICSSSFTYDVIDGLFFTDTITYIPKNSSTLYPHQPIAYNSALYNSCTCF